MTVEESKIMWQLEKMNCEDRAHTMSKNMKKLVNATDKLITDGIITYEDFTNDMISLITNINNDITKLDEAYLDLAKEYEAKHTEREHREPDTGVLVDSTEVSN